MLTLELPDAEIISRLERKVLLLMQVVKLQDEEIEKLKSARGEEHE